jgi:hypothetical protein
MPSEIFSLILTKVSDMQSNGRALSDEILIWTVLSTHLVEKHSTRELAEYIISDIINAAEEHTKGSLK